MLAYHASSPRTANDMIWLEYLRCIIGTVATTVEFDKVCVGGKVSQDHHGSLRTAAEQETECVFGQDGWWLDLHDGAAYGSCYMQVDQLMGHQPRKLGKQAER